MSIIQAQILEPYAQALMSVAQANDATEQIGEDMRSLKALLETSDELKQLLENPFVKNEDKKAILRQIGGEDLQHFTRNFLMLLVDRGRIIFLEGICAQYLNLLRKLNQTVLAEVTSAVELSSDQQQAVRDRVKSMTDARNVEIETKIDPELIGGVIIKVGSQVIDASLRGQLRRIGVRLSSAT
ncbi:F0F1 ATP synthase subunit delta [Oxynema sp. CENA135]|uniref:ATP synthase F1 subunit delta n=1 Tax=Oxynema sp. CENA135 TaxID=984206 RepID=UPI00190B3302|nr:ATP synthase F1 subunit delta [Oxynema sp. CENA135]MBK4730182.1 F0F1 ATP synthase subunit delta [Oxynema sp. CENA135]